jgi:hypothetical protein
MVSCHPASRIEARLAQLGASNSPELASGPVFFSATRAPIRRQRTGADMKHAETSLERGAIDELDEWTLAAVTGGASSKPKEIVVVGSKITFVPVAREGDSIGSSVVGPEAIDGVI